MGDWTTRDPKVRRVMQRTWEIGDRELRDAVAAQAERYAALQAQPPVEVVQATRRTVYRWLTGGLITVGIIVALNPLLAQAQDGTAQSSIAPIEEQRLAYQLYRAGEWRLYGADWSTSDGWSTYRAGERTAHDDTAQ